MNWHVTFLQILASVCLCNLEAICYWFSLLVISFLSLLQQLVARFDRPKKYSEAFYHERRIVTWVLAYYVDVYVYVYFVNSPCKLKASVRKGIEHFPKITLTRFKPESIHDTFVSNRLKSCCTRTHTHTHRDTLAHAFIVRCPKCWKNVSFRCIRSVQMIS